MYLEHDDLLEAADDLQATLRAAERTIEHLAASALSFAAAARVHRESTRRARAWLRDHLDPTPLPRIPPGLVDATHREELTDEVLRQTVDVQPPPRPAPARAASPPGPGPADDDAPSTGLITFDEPDGVEDPESDSDLSVLDFADDESAADEGDTAAFVDFDSEELEEIGGSDLDSFDEDDELEAFDGDDLIAFDDDEDVSQLLEGDLGDPDGLVSFDDDLDDGGDLSLEASSDDLVTLGGDDDSLVDFGDDDAGKPTMDDGEDHEGEVERVSKDQTLVTDLESLVKLQDLLEEEDAALVDNEPKEPVRGPRATDGRRRVATTLTDDDLDKLGFSSREALLAPEGSDADPASDTGPRPQSELETPSEVGRQVRGRGGDSQGDYSEPKGARVSLPTIRDQGASGASSRPSAAAIQLNPDGGGAVIGGEADAPLALGGADDDDDAGNGLSLDVEEYEYVDEDEDEELPELPPEPPAPPPPMPELSDDQEKELLQKAHDAVKAGKLPDAAALYSDVLDFDPDNVDATLGRGRVYLDLGDYARAMSDFTIAEELEPDHPETNAAIGELYYARKDYQRAISFFDRALKKDPNHAMAYCRRGIAHYYRKEFDRAYEDLTKARKLDGDIQNIGTYITMVKKRRR